MEGPLLSTSRLLLRPHRLDDFESLYALWRAPEVYRHILGRPSTREEAWMRLLRYAGLWPLLGYGYWAVEDKASGLYIGEIGFADFHRDMDPPLGNNPEMGWMIAPEHHGKGLATEALTAMLDWASKALPHEDCVCFISDDNAASIALARKVGFVKDYATSYKGDPVTVYCRRLRPAAS